ncbi:MAG: NlpC/P60 family protein [Allomuricauda sp.]|nr:MAG: NlpC/P60 family protein [Allomuricauda sp.]
MYRRYLILLMAISFTGCIVKKRTTYSKKRTVTVVSETGDTLVTKKVKRKKIENEKADDVVSSAMAYAGVRYRFGGSTKKGMDCSGLVHVSLKENNIDFPRVSHIMANEGKKIKVKEVRKGDLLFFKTRKSGKRINHVGLVVDVKGNEIKFIHATSSRGVIVSSLKDGFWNASFVKATRIL